MSDNEKIKWLHFAGNVLLSCLWGIFLYAHVEAYAIGHKASALLFALSESLVIIFFLMRSQARSFSHAPFDWALGFIGTFLTTLYRPSPNPEYFLGETLLSFGIVLNIAALLSLNRSFAIVPAVRNIKTKGFYTIIRHPMYASYLLMYIGYFLSNSTLANGIILLLCIAFQLARIEREEVLLSTEPVYKIYQQKVKYKLIPGIY